MSGHPTRQEDFELYALGVLEGEERAALESHAASCAECTERLGEAQGRIALLALGAPRVDVPAGAKERLLQRVRGEGAAAAAPAVFAPPPRATTWAKEDAPRARAGILGGWWNAVLVPVTLGLLIVCVLLWRQNDIVEKVIDEQRKEVAHLQKQLEYQRRVADVMEGPNVLNVALRPMPGMPKGDATVHYNAGKGKLVYDGWIEPAPSDKSYQLWVVPKDGSPISVGVFNPVTEDRASWIASLPEGVQAKAFAITLEPAGGEDQPTGPQILVGNGS